MNNAISPTRREFLYYIGGAAVALFSAGSCGAVAWFTRERFRFGSDTGVFQLAPDLWPSPNNDLTRYVEADAYLVALEDGIIALDERCIFDQWRVKWVDNNGRFECPSSGSKYRLDGSRIEGSACHGLHRLALQVTMADGTVIASNDGTPLPITNAVSVVVNTNEFVPTPPYLEPNPSYIRRLSCYRPSNSPSAPLWRQTFP